MDIPIFHLDVLNNRMLIAFIASIHVIVNHAMAVGGIPLVVFLEWKAVKSGDMRWDALAYKILRVFFVVTTTLGAMTGVGIWFSAALVNPIAIGSLIRVFFFTWLVEWLVFVTEVVLILLYFKTWVHGIGPAKERHVRLGMGLAVASWITMALIVSILGFMMDPGSWQSDRTLFSGMLNPMYLPQLAFRTPLAMLMAGAAGLVISRFVTQEGTIERERATRTLSRWSLAFLLPTVVAGIVYARRLPEGMRANVPVAVGTQDLAHFSEVLLGVLGATGLAAALVLLTGALRPDRVRGLVALVPAVACIAIIGTFERVREFVRKPYAIAGYLYSNGVRKDDMALLRRDGMLAHATYTEVRTVTPETKLAAGKEVFRLACTRCHTTNGVNGIRAHLVRMYGTDAPWSEDAISAYVAGMHAARPYMPPFPGSDAERRALAAWLVTLRDHRDAVEGAQVIGATFSPKAKGNSALSARALPGGEP
jgi:mono/diheme cytochrome c family protein